MVTIEQKDILLNYLAANCELERKFQIDKIPFSKYLFIDTSTIYAILMQMQRMGLVADVGENKFQFELVVLLELHDYLRHGGFAAQEELLAKNIQKLILELEGMKPDFSEKAGIITGIAGNIATALSLFLGK